MNSLTMAISDGMTIAKRNALQIRRTPDLLGLVIMTPIMFVLLFAYVFGSQIHIPGTSYRQYMLAGIFAQTVIFGGTLTGYGLVQDLQKGIVDRFRTLPMSPSAVLVGRTVSDLIANVSSLIVMVGTGLLIGWRVHTPLPKVLLGFLVLLVFGFAISWVMGWLALIIRSPESYNNASGFAVFPLVFLANTFIDTTRLPTPLRVVAQWNPVSAVTQAARELFGNTNAATPLPRIWPLEHPVASSLLWAALILAVFVPLTTWQYTKTVSR
jgi:ABC-2 type transport system permease protein